MIEVASHPEDLSTWNPNEQPFYLELFGETRPRVDTRYAEVVSAGSAGGAPPTTSAAPVYEYWWTMGHPGSAQTTPHLWDVFGAGEPDELWHHLREPAARVYLYFPTDGGWRTKELVATVKYLTPVRELPSVWTKLAKDWSAVGPLVGDVGSLAQLVPNPIFAGASTILAALARLQINSVPPENGFAWSVGKVTFGSKRGVMQGVMWTLPGKMFTELGGRLTGSLALSFIPARTQGKEPADVPVFEPRAILAHAVVYGPRGDIWVPGPRDFVRLQVAPTLPAE